MPHLLVNSRLVRGLAATHCLVGAALLSRPAAVADKVSEGSATPPTWVVRLLGVRVLGQGLVEATRPRGATMLAAAAVDLSHALSMVAAARWRPDYRRAALTSATAALVSAASAAASVRRAAR